MKVSEALSVVSVATTISILSGVILFGVLGLAPGVETRLIASALLVMVAITVSITLTFYLAFKRYLAERSRKVAMMTLSEDEQKVVRKIMDIGGVTEQRDLSQHFDFSGSKLSALLNNLEEKHVITKRRHRRTNKLRLTEEIMGT